MVELISDETLVVTQRAFAAGQDASPRSRPQKAGEAGRSDGPPLAVNRVRRISHPRRSWR